ncbi:MAG: MFS transporter [Lachnospiraceae bacterium]|nr:MFS transporter [uncultured Acetatifactor sp.]MCI8543088.1 MFS transporter [Lachnospiraceae bacterium]
MKLGIREKKGQQGMADKKKSLKAEIVFWILYLAYTSTYIVRLNLSVAKPALEEMGKVDTAQLAFLGSIFSLVYAVGKLVNGGIGDRVKPWIMVSVGLALAGMGNIIMGLLPPYGALIFCWGVNAFGQSMLWGPILSMVSAIYDEQTARKKATVMGTSIAAGNVMGILAASFLVNAFGPAAAFIVPGIFALGLALTVVLFTAKIPVRMGKGVSPIKQLLRREVQIMILPAMIQGIMKDNVSLFMVDYFVKRFSVDPTLNPLYILFIPVSGLAGRMLYPFVYKRMNENEDRAAAAGFLLCALFALPLGMSLWGPAAATLCLCGIYAAVSVVNTSFLAIYPMRYAKEGTVSSVSGIMDFATYLGHAVSTAVYGIVIVKFGYASMYLSWAFLSVVGLLILAAVRRGAAES